MSLGDHFLPTSFYHGDISQFQDYGAESVASGTTDTDGMADSSDSEQQQLSPYHHLVDDHPYDASRFTMLLGSSTIPPYALVHMGTPQLGTSHGYAQDLYHIESSASFAQTSSSSSSWSAEIRGEAAGHSSSSSSNAFEMPPHPYLQSSFMSLSSSSSHPPLLRSTEEPTIREEQLSSASSPTGLPGPGQTAPAPMSVGGGVVSGRRAQKGQGKSPCVARRIPTHSRGRHHSASDEESADDEEEEKPTRKGGKQRRRTVKNQQLSVDPGIRMPALAAHQTTPYIEGQCNDSQFVHVKKSAKAGVQEPYKLEVALPVCAEDVTVNYLIIPKSAATATSEDLLAWHRLSDLREFNGAISLPWSAGLRRAQGETRVEDEEEDHRVSARGRRGATDPNSLVRQLFHLDLPGSSASIAYIRVTYSMPGSERRLVLHTQPFVVYTQLKQRQKGIGYFLRLYVDLNLRFDYEQVTVTRYLDAVNEVLYEGFPTNSSATGRQITIDDLKYFAPNDTLLPGTNLNHATFQRITALLCPLLYVLRCKSRHPKVKGRWFAGKHISRVIDAIADPADPEDQDDVAFSIPKKDRKTAFVRITPE